MEDIVVEKLSERADGTCEIALVFVQYISLEPAHLSSSPKRVLRFLSSGACDRKLNSIEKFPLSQYAGQYWAVASSHTEGIIHAPRISFKVLIPSWFYITTMPYDTDFIDGRMAHRESLYAHKV